MLRSCSGHAQAAAHAAATAFVQPQGYAQQYAPSSAGAYAAAVAAGGMVLQVVYGGSLVRPFPGLKLAPRRSNCARVVTCGAYAHVRCTRRSSARFLERAARASTRSGSLPAPLSTSRGRTYVQHITLHVLNRTIVRNRADARCACRSTLDA